LVKTGDWINLDVSKRTLMVEIEEAELERRKKAWKKFQPPVNRGYVHLYTIHVEQSHLGADFDFLKGGSGSVVTRDSH